MSAAAPATIAATSEDIITTSAPGVKAVATTAAALRKCSKVNEGSLPEHNFLSREEIHLCYSGISDKLCGADDLKESFRIQFEKGDMQREELICSRCLSTHHDINNTLCILFSVDGKFWKRICLC
jgi:hypothetical protein